MKYLCRIISAAILIIFFVLSPKAQIVNPISWKFSQKQVNDSVYTLTMVATIQSGWHLYSQHIPDSITIPTAFTFTPAPDYTLDGKTEEGTPVTKYEKTFSTTLKYFLNTASFSQNIRARSKNGFALKGNVYFITCNDSMCLPPKQVNFSIAIPAATASSASSESTGYMGIWILGFLGGLIALFTPCVFPMIPLTVSFFTKKTGTRKTAIKNAITYGLSIITIYVLLGVIITAIFGSSGLNAIASNGWVNLFFFIIFVIFGCSFLGAFELTLPSSWANKTDSASDKGGIMGIFFMALTLCIVSFSCTVPIVGQVLAGASLNGSYWSLAIGMFGFSTALALPFALFSMFPAWLNSLPSSGGWLNSVKVVLGLLEIAFSLKFLSTADLVGLHIKFLHIHINGPMGFMKREIFVALWIIIYAIIGFYLLGKLRFHHDSEVKHVSVFRLMLAIVSFAFTVYLIPGLFGSPLKLIGGFPPPDWYTEGWHMGGDGNNKTATPATAGSNSSVAVQKVGCPLNLNCYHDYNDALAEAKRTNKPVMIDFTGFACVNCRKMEENVWSDPKVLSIISNDFILVSLYVDDKTELPENMQYVSKISGQKVETYGDKWSDMETERFKSNTQPLYVLMANDDTEIASPRGYTPDVEKYVEFLNQGKGGSGKATAQASNP
jgi:thiol:disulfide interchange protein